MAKVLIISICIFFIGYRSSRPGYVAPYSRTRNIIFEAGLFLVYGLKNEEYYI